MSIPSRVIANADDFGLSDNVNNAALTCINKGYINSISFLTNMPAFENGLGILTANRDVKNIGLHANFACGRPLTNFKSKRFLDQNGDWDIVQTNQKSILLNTQERNDFYNELCAQLNIILKNNITLSHLDSHCHLHNLPAFFNLFIEVAKQFKLKIRLAQTYNESNYLKFAYRMFLNYKLKSLNLNYSDYFETAKEFLKGKRKQLNSTTEIMLHPHINHKGEIIDSVDGASVQLWIDLCNSTKLSTCNL